MNSDVNVYVRNSKQWRAETEALRSVLLKCRLTEDFKWSKPCYTFEGNNIAIIQPFKACLGLMFFKGVLLKDPEGILAEVGPNSQSAMRIEITSVQQITKLASTIKAYVKEAVELETSGQKVERKTKPEPIPTELKEMFKADTKLKKAFEALTPGRQRAYVLHFSGAKLSETRKSRIEKCTPRILEGKGLNDR